MKIRGYGSLAALGLIVTCAATKASAADSGFYVGLNFGQSSFDVDESEVKRIYGTTAAIDDSDTAWSVTAGYRFVRYFGIEANYLDIGGVNISNSVNGGAFLSYTNNAVVSATGLGMVLVGTIPLGKLELNARVGFLSTTTDFSRSSSSSLPSSSGPPYVTSYSTSTSADTTETQFAIGFGFPVGSHFHLRADWTRIPDAGDDEKTGEADVSILTAGVQYRF